jgi:hypothetical protein
MVVHDAEVERLAREMIAAHGTHAARAAAERLNEMIDRHDIPGRNVWACVVHAIHERQGTAPLPGRPWDWCDGASRLEAAF